LWWIRGRSQPRQRGRTGSWPRIVVRQSTSRMQSACGPLGERIAGGEAGHEKPHRFAPRNDRVTFINKLLELLGRRFRSIGVLSYTAWPRFDHKRRKVKCAFNLHGLLYGTAGSWRQHSWRLWFFALQVWA